MTVPDDIWDRDPLLLGVRNGVVDLRTGDLLSSSPEQYISLFAGIEFQADAVCPILNRFLERVQPMPHQRDYLQLLSGYSATALTREQLMHIHFGSGGNGKGTFFEVLHQALGDYADAASPALMDAKGDRREQLYAIAKLVGKRLVSVSETDSNMQLAMAALKRLTGEDPVAARHMHQDLFTFKPVCKLHLSTNHLPSTRDNSYGAKRRLRIVEWSECITKEEQESTGRHLRENLHQELPGILAWIVRGSILYLRDGLPVTQSSTEKATRLLSQQDSADQWIADRIIRSSTDHVQSSVAHDDYCRWNEATSHSKALPIQNFVSHLKAAGFEQKKSGSGVMIWTGVRLRDAVMDVCDGSDALIKEPICNAESYEVSEDVPEILALIESDRTDTGSYFL